MDIQPHWLFFSDYTNVYIIMMEAFFLITEVRNLLYVIKELTEYLIPTIFLIISKSLMLQVEHVFPCCEWQHQSNIQEGCYNGQLICVMKEIKS